MIKTILADDHKLFSDGVRRLLEESGQFKVVKQFVRTDTLLEEFDQLQADLLLLDIDIPGINGMETLSRIRFKNHELKIVLLSMHEESIYAREAKSAGANGYLTKSMDSTLMIGQLMRIVQGEKIFPAGNYFQFEPESQILSKQEIKILRLIANGMTSEQIGEALSVSDLTVKVHRRNMMKKLGASNSAELVTLAFAKGII